MIDPGADLQRADTHKDKKILVHIKNLHKHFNHHGKRIDVLNGVDLKIGRGEMIAIVGISGAGKSTFLHILGTLDNPTKGSLTFNGVNVFNQSLSALAKFRNRSIGFVFQFHHLLPEFTAVENAMMPALINRIPKSKAFEMAKELLVQVDLEHRLNHKPGELSGGEQQRVALVRALVMKPKMLLADEPTGNLDRKTGEGIHRLFSQLNKMLGITIVIVTHNPDLAQMMPRQLLMQGGQIHEISEFNKVTPIFSTVT